LVKDTTRRAKKRRLFTPTTFSLLHATDFADRTERDIVPPLKAGAIVLADRYIYTAFARDVARGCDRAWVRETYKFAVKPTAAFFFRAPLDVAIDRIASARPQLKFYEAGMDMDWADDEEESFKIFQGKILDEYDHMVNEFGLTVIDGTQAIRTQQRQMREIVSRYLKEKLKEKAVLAMVLWVRAAFIFGGRQYSERSRAAVCSLMLIAARLSRRHKCAESTGHKCTFKRSENCSAVPSELGACSDARRF